MFWSINCIHNMEYKMYLKMKRWQNCEFFIDFSNKRRFEQIYKTSLQNETVRRITKRSNRREVFCKKVDLKNFTKFTWKHLCWGFFFKVAGLRPETLLKKRPQHRCFQVHFVEFFKITFLKKPSGGLFCLKDLFLSNFCNEKSFK